jgi:hypothetical protein
LTKSLHNNEEKQWRERITLPKTSGTLKKTTRATINKNGKTHRGDAKSDPVLPMRRKTTPLEHIKKEVPINMVIGLLHIQFTQYTWISLIQSTIQTFRRNEN